MKTLAKTLGFLVIVGLGVVFYLRGCGKGSKAETQVTKKPVPVEVTSVKRATLEDIIHGKGTLHALEEATISPKIPGKIAKIQADEGVEVKEGLDPALSTKSQPLAEGSFETSRSDTVSPSNW